MSTGLKTTMRREVGRLASRRIYLFTMVLVPVLMSLFFVDLLGPGLPLKIPSAIVDLDHSPMSRSIARSINSTELIDITCRLESYEAAMEATRKGDIFGFFIIPSNFQSDALAGRTPTLEYYTNMTYFVPGTLAYKGFKTVAVGTAGSMVRATLISAGADPETVGSLIRPLNVDAHPIGNPWTNYSYYLTPSFLAGLFALMIMLVTSFSISNEIKSGTSAGWLSAARGRMSVALAGKLIPQFVIWVAVCVGQPGNGGAVCIDCAESASFDDACGTVRHTLILVCGIFVSGAEHVWGDRHIQLSDAGALLLSYICQ